MKLQLRQLEPKINVNPTMKPRNMSGKNKGRDKIEMLTIEPKNNAFFVNPNPNFKQKLGPNPTIKPPKKPNPRCWVSFGFFHFF